MSWAPRTRPAPRRWVWGKWAVLAGAAGMLAALITAPEVANRTFWYLVVPVLPALFLVNAEVWRNVCPIATLSTLNEREDQVRPLDPAAAKRWTGAGIALFLLLVPLRHLLFEGSALATAGLITTAGAAALVGGRLLDRKAGFCNSICPILPVERLYGQRPLTRVSNARCVPCRACTQHACFDLNPQRSGLVTLGAAASGRGWVTTPFGAFTLALPGFIVAFSLIPSTAATTLDMAAAAGVYGKVALGAALSWAILGSLFTVLSTRPVRALAWTAFAAASAYYWFTPSAIVSAWGMDPAWLPVLRSTSLLLVCVWMWRALLRPGARSLVPARLDS